MKHLNETKSNNLFRTSNTQNDNIEMPNIYMNTSSFKKNNKLDVSSNKLTQKNGKNFEVFKHQIMKPPMKENEIIKDYLNLIRCTYPFCNCGKCILRKNREHSSSPNYNYDKNIRSNYQNEFKWKSPQRTDYIQNAKLSRLDKGFKEHLKSGLISVMRNDYKNIGVITEPNNENLPKYRKNLDNDVQMKKPFLGRSSYETLFPNWQTAIDKKDTINSEAKEAIPFSGKSSYKETFGNIEPKYYIEKTSPILKKDNIEVGVFGKLIGQTTNGECYKPIDLKKAKALNNIKSTYAGFPGSIATGSFSKDSFMSSYERAFMNNNFKGYLKYNFNTQN